MFRGLLSGVFWGAITGALILVFGSLAMPLPDRRSDAEAPSEPTADASGGAEPEVAAGDEGPEEAPEDEPQVEEQASVTPEPEPEPEPQPDPAPEPEPEPAAEEPASAEPVETADAPEPEAAPEQGADVADTGGDLRIVPTEEPETSEPEQAAELLPSEPPVVAETPELARLTPPARAPLPVTPQATAEQAQEEVTAPEPPAAPIEPEVPEPPPSAEVAETAPPPPEPEPVVEPEPVPEIDQAEVPLPAPTETVEAPVEAAPTEEIAQVEPEAQPLPEPEPQREAAATPTPAAEDESGPEVTTDSPTGIGQPVTGIGQPVRSFGDRVTPGFGNRAEGVRVNRLPTVGGETDVEPEAETVAAEAADVETEEPASALERFAADFENPDARPLFSVIMIDIGTDQGGLERSALSTFPFPVAFAIPAERPDAAEAAQAYREAGFEVVMVAGALPQRATPADLEVAFQVFEAAVPEAVAVLDPPGGGFQANRTQAEQIVSILNDAGYGFLAMDRGLNNSQQIAAREGVPSGSIFRNLDESSGSPEELRRTLDRAAFRAGQEGSVILLASTLPGTVSTLFAWALEGRAEGVALAPVSAVLLGQ